MSPSSTTPEARRDELRGPRTLHVMLVTTSLSRAGTQLSTLELIPELQAHGIAVSIASVYPWQDELDAEMDAFGVRVHKLSEGKLNAKVAELRRLIIEEGPDLVHTMIVAADIIGRLAARGLTPVLTSLVNTPWTRARFNQPMAVRARLLLYRTRWLDRRTARRHTAHFHAVSAATKSTAMATLGIPAKKVTVIERGRDSSRLGCPGEERRIRARRALDLGDDELVVITVGRQDHQKGQRHLVEAISRLPTSWPVTALVVGRRGQASDELERMVGTTEQPSRVRLLGHRDDVPELLAAADLFVMPSLYEGMSGAVIEAMALGLPVVATAIPGMEELVDEGVTGTMVPPGDSAALAAAMTTLLPDADARARLGRAGRARYEERFTLDRSVGLFVALYDELATGARFSR